MVDSVRDSRAFTWDFFIAHAGADIGAAEELYELMASQCRVFLDSRCLLLGDDWVLELPKAQRQSRITIALLSSQTDSAHYQRDEIGTAIAMARANSNFHRVVPVFLEEPISNESNIQYGLRTKHGIAVGRGGIPGVARSLLDLLARLDGKSSDPSSASTSSGELEQIRAIAQRIGYSDVGKSRGALKELIDYVSRSGSSAVRHTAAAIMKDLILTLGDFDGEIVPMRIREMRKLVLEVVKVSAEGKLGSKFQERELEYLDLYGMNFASEDLCGVSFRGCFLVGADFQSSNLAQASFADASLRNANLRGADLSGADLTGVDWFNALGLTESQLRAARHGTLLKCPSDVQGMHLFLKTRYSLPFESWSRQVQDQLQRTWVEYLGPGGLRDAVER